MKRKSKIFSNREHDAVMKRMKGNTKDEQGIFHGRAKPKILEILEVWLPKKKKLEELIKSKRNE